MAIITTDKVKTLLQISGSTYDTLIAELIPIVQNFIVEKTNNRFTVKNRRKIYRSQSYLLTEKEGVYIEASTIAFNNATPATITDSDSNFLDQGFPASDIDIDVVNSKRNDDIYAVDTVEAGTMTLKTGEELLSEEAGNLVTIYLVKFPKGLWSTVADMILWKMDKKRFLKSWSLADYSKTMIGEGGYPQKLLDELKPYTLFKWD